MGARARLEAARLGGAPVGDFGEADDRAGAAGLDRLEGQRALAREQPFVPLEAVQPLGEQFQAHLAADAVRAGNGGEDDLGLGQGLVGLLGLLRAFLGRGLVGAFGRRFGGFALVRGFVGGVPLGRLLGGGLLGGGASSAAASSAARPRPRPAALLGGRLLRRQAPRRRASSAAGSSAAGASSAAGSSAAGASSAAGSSAAGASSAAGSSAAGASSAAAPRRQALRPPLPRPELRLPAAGASSAATSTVSSSAAGPRRPLPRPARRRLRPPSWRAPRRAPWPCRRARPSSGSMRAGRSRMPAASRNLRTRSLGLAPTESQWRARSASSFTRSSLSLGSSGL